MKPIAVMTRAAALVAVVAIVGACGGATASPTVAPTPTPRPLTDAETAWCTLHTGGPGEDMHQVEDMAITLGVIPGAKTRDDIFARWAGHTADQSAADPTYRAACAAAYAAFASPAPSST